MKASETKASTSKISRKTLKERGKGENSLRPIKKKCNSTKREKPKPTVEIQISSRMLDLLGIS